MEQQLFLKPNVMLEPLVDHCYAWRHLIAPLTSARSLAERHFKIMDSYIQAPQIHAAAVKDAAFRGGPFIDYAVQRVDEIKKLRDETCSLRSDLIEISTALEELHRLLSSQAKGY